MANFPSNVIPFPRLYRAPPRQSTPKHKSKLNYLERECVRRNMERMGIILPNAD